MPRTPLDAPGDFALLVSDAIRRELGARRLSGRALGRILNKSEKYVRERVTDRYEFTLNDVELFCEYMGVLPEWFIAERVERPNNVTPLRRNVGTSSQDAENEEEQAAYVEQPGDRPDETS